MDDVADHVDDPRVLIAALDRSSARLFGYLDSVIARLLRHYQEERERWLGGTLARRAEVVHAILAGDDDTPAASRALGFELERPLLALALWRTDDPPPAEHPLDGLERLAQAIAGALGAGRALTLPAGSTTLWAWIGSGALAEAAAAAQASRGPAEAVALGGPAAGAAGLRDAHRDALEARRVARLAGAAGVVRHDEAEIAALVSADPERLRRFVARTLGPLAEDAAGPERLRDSLGAWFAAGGNARLAAEALGTHKNTVLYRVRRAEELLGRPLDTGALDVQLALEAVRRVGLDPSA
jgi:DNA-binding PucR family transcriptional regulator